METYNQLLFRAYHKYEDKLDIATLRLYLYELCFAEDINLYLMLDETAKKSIAKEFEKGVEELALGKPLNYVLGYSWFYGYKLKVSPSVLIPRFETEELVGHLLAYIDELKNDDLSLVDVGTGSGALAIALKKEAPFLKVKASDISLDALKVAEENAMDNDAKITFYEGDMLKPFVANNDKFDIIVSNPPYIPDDEKIEHSVKDFEPHVALFGGQDGLDHYRDLLKDVPKVLKENGLVAFEMGYNQKEALTNLVHSYFENVKIDVQKDINGKDRMMFVKF